VESLLLEGGQPVAFVLPWPREILPGSSSASTLHLTDHKGAGAETFGSNRPAGAEPDRVRLLAGLEEHPSSDEREAIILWGIKRSGEPG
jgi:hypothetical protein